MTPAMLVNLLLAENNRIWRVIEAQQAIADHFDNSGCELCAVVYPEGDSTVDRAPCPVYDRLHGEADVARETIIAGYKKRDRYVAEAQSFLAKEWS